MSSREVVRVIETTALWVTSTDEDGDPVLLKEPPIFRARNAAAEGCSWLEGVEWEAAQKEHPDART